MKLQIPDKVNPNCHVFKLGWTYPICFNGYLEFSQAKSILVPNFGLAAEQWHFGAPRCLGRPPVVKYGLEDLTRSPGDLTRSPLTAKYYTDSRMWHRTGTSLDDDFWIVFKEEKDRTLALMMLS